MPSASILLDEALRLQDEAIALLTAEQGEIDDVAGHLDRTEGWLVARQKLAETQPRTAVDALALLHHLRQTGLALLAQRDKPETVYGYAMEICIAAWSLIQAQEACIGLTRADLGLMDRYPPPRVQAN